MPAPASATLVTDDEALNAEAGRRRIATRPAPILPDDLLDRTVLRHWQKGERRDVTGRAFWNSVARHAAWVEAHTPEGAFVLVIGHSSAAMMALFIGIATAGRRGACFPPHSPLQDERHFYEQQYAALTAIDPAAICVMDPRRRRHRPPHRRRARQKGAAGAVVCGRGAGPGSCDAGAVPRTARLRRAAVRPAQLRHDGHQEGGRDQRPDAGRAIRRLLAAAAR